MLEMDALNQKVQGVVRDSQQFISAWFFDTERSQVVFRKQVEDETKEFRLGYAAVTSLPHSTLCEWVRASVNAVSQ